MGKSKDKKKKGKGMEKTLAKTEKKAQKNLKKELEEIGEEDIEKIIQQMNEKEKELNQLKEELLPVGQFPRRRGGATLNLLPERDELILFGGDYFDGDKVYMFNDLHIYSIRKNQWTRLRAPKPPPPRTFHQSVVISRNGGELWLFGGEFSSPSQTQFYHYNDLWVFSFQTKQWTKIQSPNAPSARSGHRMVHFKKYLIVFGGYYDNNRNCRFYNDTYLFNLETNQWEEMKFSASPGVNEPPSVRSACQMCVCSKTNSIIVYGGFSKEKQAKKGKEKGIIHSDMYSLTAETRKNDQTEWCWKRVKQAGLRPSERISFSMVTLHDDTAVLFGGVYDQDDQADMDEDDESNSNFFNDLYKLDLASHKWSQITLRGKKELKSKKPKQEAASKEAEDEGSEEEEQEEDEEAESEKLNEMKIDEKKPADEESNVFQLSYAITSKQDDTVVVTQNEKSTKNIFIPHERRSSYLQFHKGLLYLYGGKFEDKNDREYTFNDMYCLNLKKLDEWQTIYEDKELHLEIKKSIENSDDDLDDVDDDVRKKKKMNPVEGAEKGEDQDEDDDDDDDDDDEDDESMEIDAPKIEPNEKLEDYFNRTNEVWINEASSAFPDEKSKKILNKMALELCTMFWKNFKSTQ